MEEKKIYELDDLEEISAVDSLDLSEMSGEENGSVLYNGEYYTTAKNIELMELYAEFNKLYDYLWEFSADTFSDIIGSLGELETKKLRVKSKVEATKSQLSAFQVHPQYKDIETEANSITQQVHELINQTISLKRRLDAYKKNIKEDEDVSTDDIKTVYEKAGLEIPNMVVKRLDDAVNFHKEVIKNRTDYLIEEVKSLENKLIETEATIESLSKRKTELMNILNTHKALEEYNLLQQKHLKTVSELENIERKIELIRKF
jgi:uncharacterized protein YydD (DUF2326 family)